MELGKDIYGEIIESINSVIESLDTSHPNTIERAVYRSVIDSIDSITTAIWKTEWK